MSKVSSKTHTPAQRNNYANQNNPNSSAYRANQNNRSNQLNPNNPAYHSSRGQGKKWYAVNKKEQGIFPCSFVFLWCAQYKEKTQPNHSFVTK